MTEDEAKTKWCPFGRYLATFRNEAGKLETAGSYNRGAEDSGLRQSNCIGSACMAWRIDERYLKMEMDDKGILFRPGYEGVHGSCGLAGKP